MADDPGTEVPPERGGGRRDRAPRAALHLHEDGLIDDSLRLVRRVDAGRVLTIALGVGGGLLLVSGIEVVLVRIYDIIVVTIISLFLSFGMEPAVKWMDDRGIRRGAGTGVVFFLTFLMMVGFVAAMAPLIIDQVTNLIDGGPQVLAGLAERARSLPGDAGESLATWLEEQQAQLPERLPELAPRLAEGALGFGTSLLGSVLQFLTAALITFYLVADGPRLRRVLSSRMAPERQAEFLEIWELAVEKTGGYLYGRVLTAVASTIFHVIVFQMIGLPYAFAMGVWVGLVSSVIPVIGTYLAGALPLVIALSSSVSDAVWVLVAITIYQQVENYLIGPRITAHTMEVHPAVAFVSVLVGAALMGAPGALLSLPAVAILSALVSAAGERHEVVEHRLTTQRTVAKPPPPT